MTREGARRVRTVASVETRRRGSTLHAALRGAAYGAGAAGAFTLLFLTFVFVESWYTTNVTGTTYESDTGVLGQVAGALLIGTLVLALAAPAGIAAGGVLGAVNHHLLRTRVGKGRTGRCAAAGLAGTVGAALPPLLLGQGTLVLSAAVGVLGAGAAYLHMRREQRTNQAGTSGEGA